MPWRARTIVQRHGARRALRPQLKREPLGRHTSSVGARTRTLEARFHSISERRAACHRPLGPNVRLRKGRWSCGRSVGRNLVRYLSRQRSRTRHTRPAGLGPCSHNRRYSRTPHRCGSRAPSQLFSRPRLLPALVLPPTSAGHWSDEKSVLCTRSDRQASRQQG